MRKSSVFTRIVFTIILLSFTCLLGQGNKKVEVQFIEEIQMSKKDIFDNSILWIAESFKSSKAVIDLKDLEKGIIIGNGVVDIEIGWLVKTPAKFNFKIDIKEKKYRFTFKDIVMVLDGMDKPIENANRELLEPKISEKFEELLIDFRKYLLSAKKNDEW